MTMVDVKLSSIELRKKVTNPTCNIPSYWSNITYKDNARTIKEKWNIPIKIIRITLNFSAEKNKNDTSNETHVHKHTHAVIQQEKWNISVQVHDFEI